jgi:hypothetical protein
MPEADSSFGCSARPPRPEAREEEGAETVGVETIGAQAPSHESAAIPKNLLMDQVSATLCVPAKGPPEDPALATLTPGALSSAALPPIAAISEFPMGETRAVF